MIVAGYQARPFLSARVVVVTPSMRETAVLFQDSDRK
jgi:hypothetical protein